MRKYLVLNVIQPTRVRKRLLEETYQTFLNVVKEALKASDGIRSRG